MSDVEAERTPWPLAFLIVHPGTEQERSVSVHDVVVIGRECAGVEENRRLIIDEDEVSRRHVEVRLDAGTDRAVLFDTSTNGTRLNGARVERATEVALKPGDRLTVGKVEIEFRTDRFSGVATDPSVSRSTVHSVSLTKLAMVAGDLIGFAAISQYTEENILLRSIDGPHSRLRDLLGQHSGAHNSYVTDAFFGIWELDQDPEATEHALAFAVAAAELVAELAPELDLRTPDDDPIRMGWGVNLGLAAISTVTGSKLAVLGDATNLTFELSAAAGRDGRPEVVTTAGVESQLRDRYLFTPPEELMVKGRLGAEVIFGVKGRVQAGS